MTGQRLALLGLVVLVVAGCGSGKDSASPAPDPTLPPVHGPAMRPTNTVFAPVQLTPQEVNQRLSEGDAILLDVREPVEWSQVGHIDGAVLIPLAQLASRANELDTDAEIIVVCNTGRVSREGVQMLQTLGFSNLSEMRGGIVAWAAEGLPVVVGE